MGLLFDVLIIVVLIVVLVGATKPSLLTNKKTGESISRAVALKAGAVLLPILFLLSCIFSADKEMPGDGTLAERVQFLAHATVEVNELSDRIMITWSPKTADSGNSWVWGFFTDAENILKRLSEASHGKEYAEVSFLAKVPLRDNLGNEHSVTGMKVFYDGETLKQAKWDKMSTFDVMEIPREVAFSSAHGRDLANEYCNDGDKKKYTMKFCWATVKN